MRRGKEDVIEFTAGHDKVDRDNKEEGVRMSQLARSCRAQFFKQSRTAFQRQPRRPRLETATLHSVESVSWTSRKSKGGLERGEEARRRRPERGGAKERKRSRRNI